jgi:hypothetical protein
MLRQVNRRFPFYQDGSKVVASKNVGFENANFKNLRNFSALL